MRHSDIGDHADVGARDLRQSGHLAEMADPHLQDGDLMFLPDIEDGKRESDLIVEVSLGLKYVEFLAEHGGDHLLCARLAYAAGDADDTDIQ